jgi:uncharacterized protein
MTDDNLITEQFERSEPASHGRAEAFWQGGAAGQLRLMRCQDCGRYLHPPLPRCPACHGARIEAATVSGRGTVYSWTLNRYPWLPSMPVPYVVAQVDLVEQEGLRLTSNIVGCDPTEVHIGMPVEVCFVRAGAAYIPLFRPVAP